MKVLHVLKNLGRGGIETWLMQLASRQQPAVCDHHFALHDEPDGVYLQRLRALGCQVFHCPSHPARRFRSNFLDIATHHGPYAAVHSHDHFFSGYVLRCAEAAGIPIRIAHSHMDSSQIDAASGPWRRLYLFVMRALIKRHATHGIAVSKAAASALFGTSWHRDTRWSVQQCGVDLTRFTPQFDRDSTRLDLGIPGSAFVLGHAGSFLPVKNHAFMLQVLAEMLKIRPGIVLVMAGDGPERTAIERSAEISGLLPNCRFLGDREDIPRVLSAFDVFLFPSHHEGLGLAAIEAQAAGVMVMASDAVPEEAEVIPDLMRRLPLSLGARTWAKEILALPVMARRSRVSEFAHGAHDLDESMASFARLYGSAS